MHTSHQLIYSQIMRINENNWKNIFQIITVAKLE